MTSIGLQGSRPSIIDVRGAVCKFLRELLPDAQNVTVSRLAEIEPNANQWEAEAEVWQPNAMIQSLGLPIQHPVLDPTVYVVRVDGQLNILGFEVQV